MEGQPPSLAWGDVALLCRNALIAARSAVPIRLNVFPLLIVTAILVGSDFPAEAQTPLSSGVEISDELRSRLERRFSLDLRDTTLLEALFAIRDVSGLNIVAGDEVSGSVNASFANAPVHEILDSLLIARGYGYRVVGGSLAIVPLAEMGNQLPLFETDVIGLSHCSPEDLLDTVKAMLSPEGRAHAVKSSNSVVISDYPARIAAVRQHVEQLENAAAQFRRATADLSGGQSGRMSVDESKPGEDVRVFQTQYVPAEVLTEALTPLLSDTGRVSAVNYENKIIVADRPEIVERIAMTLPQIDRPRPQVRIWALIYDCSTEDLERLGINWNSGINGRSVIAATGAAAHSIAIESTTNPVETGANGVVKMVSLNRYTNVESLIQALETAEDSRLLADPNVVVMNHEAAEIAIVTEVPYQQLTQGLQGGSIGTTEFREAGVTLNVVPHIADDSTIALEVNPKFSLLTGFTDPDNAPIIDRRETLTTVRVTDNQTIILGGLRQRTRIGERSLIPGLGRIPYLGKLFRHRSASTRESELLVFITPQIVIGDCVGTCREGYVNQFLEREIQETPSDPVPYGIEALKAEQKAEEEKIDHIHLRNKLHSFRHQNARTLQQTEACAQYDDGLIEPISLGLSTDP